jgi:polyhydroxybutyrate depolymerase
MNVARAQSWLSLALPVLLAALFLLGAPAGATPKANVSSAPPGRPGARSERPRARSRPGLVRDDSRPGEGTTFHWHLRSGGRWRVALVHLPDHLPAGGAPLLLVLHGYGETASTIEAITGFDELSDEDGFIVAYPQGVDRSWNDGRGTTPASRLGVDDVAFVQQLVLRIEATWPVDPDRVYATGFSNGAVLTERLGCELSGELAAIAPVSGLLAASLAPGCHPLRALPVMLVIGTSDPVMPYLGGEVHSHVGGVVLSADATISLWARLDACTTSSTASLAAAPWDGTGVELRRYEHCKTGDVELASVVGGVHTWPGGAPHLPEVLRSGLPGLFATRLGVTAPLPRAAFLATEQVWDFLSRQSLGGPGAATAGVHVPAPR